MIPDDAAALLAEDAPPVPLNPRVVLADGTEYPVELVYEGFFDGTHRWRATLPLRMGSGAKLSVDVMPAHTGIAFRMYDEEEST